MKSVPTPACMAFGNAVRSIMSRHHLSQKAFREMTHIGTARISAILKVNH